MLLLGIFKDSRVRFTLTVALSVDFVFRIARQVAFRDLPAAQARRLFSRLGRNKSRVISVPQIIFQAFPESIVFFKIKSMFKNIETKHLI